MKRGYVIVIVGGCLIALAPIVFFGTLSMLDNALKDNSIVLGTFYLDPGENWTSIVNINNTASPLYLDTISDNEMPIHVFVMDPEGNLVADTSVWRKEQPQDRSHHGRPLHVINY